MLKEGCEACNICLNFSTGSPNGRRPEFYDDGGIAECYSTNTECLPKDRAIIVLLDRLLKKRDE